MRLLSRLIHSSPARRGVQRTTTPTLRSFSISSPDASVPYSSYEYPTRTSPPQITKTLASDLPPIPPQASSSPKHRPNNHFDDAPPTFTPHERSDILRSQKTQLRSSLAPHHKISPTGPPPSLLPPLQSPRTSELPQVQTSVLSNGLRIISLENYSQVATIGLIADFGSRYEEEGSTGCNHLMEILGFHSTPGFESVSDYIAELGGGCYVNSGREQIMYCIDILRGNAESGLAALTESVLSPNYTPDEVAFGKNILRLTFDELSGDARLWENLMTAAYPHSQLGRPHICPPDAVENLSSEVLTEFRRRHLCPRRVVLSATGMRHEVLHSLAEKYLGSWSPVVEGGHPKRDSVYEGGVLCVPTSVNDPEWERVALAFEIPGGWNSSDLVPACVLQTLLGGGNSFSAGGPGKGMYSRLYREILNRFYWVESAESITHFHSETGLFSLGASCPPDKTKDVTRVLANHFIKLATTDPTEEEIRRAKNMLKCNVLTQLESRLVTMEDLGRQLLTFGKRESQEEMLDKIDAVQKEDLRRVGEDMIKRPVTMSVVGEGGRTLEEVQGWFKN